jgi:hypothetical protein
MDTSVSRFSLASLLHSFLNWLHTHGVSFFGLSLSSLLNLHSFLSISSLAKKNCMVEHTGGGQEKGHFLSLV